MGQGTHFRAQPDAFDLVITDQTMPNLNGCALIEAMRTIRPDLPVILCTGYSSLISETKAKSHGINGFAYKPHNIKDLGGLVRQVLDRLPVSTSGAVSVAPLTD